MEGLGSINDWIMKDCIIVPLGNHGDPDQTGKRVGVYFHHPKMLSYNNYMP